MIKKRNLFVAGLFNFISPGLGFLYVGRLAYAIGFPLLSVLLIGLSSWSKVIFSAQNFAPLMTLGLSLWLFGIGLASFMAYRAGTVELTNVQKWYIYLGFFLLSSLVGNVLMEHRSKVFGYETFRFPSVSMMETLMPGDFVISNTWKYKTTSPSRGEVVVFLYPKDPSVKYIKRVIGLPGDYVEIENGKISINGRKLEEEYVDDRNNQQLSFQKPGNYRVPDNAFFVLGDNRDNSNDSRFWGFVPRDYIYGSVEYIWFSYDPASGIRSERIGKSVK